jgi:hypothetical protein
LTIFPNWIDIRVVTILTTAGKLERKMYLGKIHYVFILKFSPFDAIVKKYVISTC